MVALPEGLAKAGQREQKSETDEDDESSTARVRRRAADREFIDKMAERLEREGWFDLVWARDRSNRRNADLGGSKV